MLKHKITMILLKPFEKGRVMAYFYSGLRNQTPPTQGGPPSQSLSMRTCESNDLCITLHHVLDSHHSCPFLSRNLNLVFFEQPLASTRLCQLHTSRLT